VKLFRRILVIPFASILVAVLAVALMYVLFVFPNPTGFLFLLLKLLVIGFIGYLFYHLFSLGKERERLLPFSRSLPYKRKDKKSGAIKFRKEDESELKRTILGILELFSASFPEFSISAYVLDSSEVELVQRGYSGKGNIFQETILLNNSTLQELLKKERPQIITFASDSEIFSSFVNNKTKIPPSASLLISSISIDEKIKGMLLIEADKFSDFEENHRDIAALYAGLIAMELQQLDFLSSIRSDNLFFTHLEAFQNDLDIDRSEDELLSSLIRFCKNNFSFDKLTISLKHEDHAHEAIVAAVSGFTQDMGQKNRYQISGSLHGRVISRGKSILIDNLITAPQIEGRFIQGDITDYQFLSFLGTPIKNKNGVIGALVLESFASRKYSQADLRILQVIGERTGILLDWWKNHEIIKETAMRDGLTGLLNHKSFMERFDEEINRANRFQEQLVLLVLDLDKFKRINDTHGHLYGDYVLEETANSLRMSVRNIDIVARYGGEEFAIVLISATKEGVYQTTRRIINNIATHEFNKDGISVQMTISAGASEFPTDGATIRDLIAKADEAMYKVKRRGGNDVNLTESSDS